MKKKELKKRFAACEQSLQRTNENFDQLCKDNKEQARTIDDLTRLQNSKIKYIDQLKKENGDCYAEYSKLLQELKDERARIQKEWEGNESVEERKAAAYWRECYEIKEAEVIQYKEEVKELKSKLAVKVVSDWVEDAKQIDELKREIQEKAAQIKNQRDLIEKYQKDVKELKQWNDQLSQWKKEAVAVMPDFQKIGELLGIRIGESVVDKIIPGIESLQSRIKDRNEVVKRLTEQSMERAAEIERLKEGWDVGGIVKNQQEEIEELKIVIKDRDEKIEKLKGRKENLPLFTDEERGIIGQMIRPKNDE